MVEHVIWSEKVVVSFVNQSFRMIDRICLFPRLFPAFEQNRAIRRAVINEHVTLYYRISQGQNEIELLTFLAIDSLPISCHFDVI
jgi:hypothetical protein